MTDLFYIVHGPKFTKKISIIDTLLEVWISTCNLWYNFHEHGGEGWNMTPLKYWNDILFVILQDLIYLSQFTLLTFTKCLLSSFLFSFNNLYVRGVFEIVWKMTVAIPRQIPGLYIPWVCLSKDTANVRHFKQKVHLFHSGSGISNFCVKCMNCMKYIKL